MKVKIWESNCRNAAKTYWVSFKSNLREMIKANRRAEAGDIAEHSRHSFPMLYKGIERGKFQVGVSCWHLLAPSCYRDHLPLHSRKVYTARGELLTGRKYTETFPFRFPLFLTKKIEKALKVDKMEKADDPDPRKWNTVVSHYHPCYHYYGVDLSAPGNG